MTTKLIFLGAAQNVTGSRFLLDTNGTRILIDCGLYQEREFKARNWDAFPVPPSSIDALLLTHAHLDHSGFLPKLARDGFTGKVYCTDATADITQIALLDSAKIQVEDAEFKRKRHEREGRKGPYPEIPLYTVQDAESCCRLLTSIKYEEKRQIADGIEVSYHDAGHILGAAMIKIVIGTGEKNRTIIFSGDVGRWDKPILRNPTVFHEADYVLVESTYGDRVHDSDEDVNKALANTIKWACKRGGNILIPSFAIERAQEVLYHLNELQLSGRIPHLMVFVDSPMAVNVTEAFKRHADLFDEEMTDFINRGESPFRFPGLTMVKTVEQSKAINRISGTIITIAGSGMCTGGRIKHHLANNISKKNSVILFVGYQAKGTLGRSIADGAKEVRILGEKRKVLAKVARVEGFSGHADRNELDKWLSNLTSPPKKTFVIHGEVDSAKSFSAFLAEKKGWDTHAPGYGEEFILD